MTRQFGPAGMLEVRRAMEQSDADGVLAAAARYRGTEAAAEAVSGLGDRAVGGGEFNRARVWYRQAKQNGNAAIAKRVAPHDRLAAAMLGQDVGKPATEPVQFGEVTMPAADFESLVADMRKTHAADGPSHSPARSPRSVAGAAPLPLPAASNYSHSNGSTASWATIPANSTIPRRAAAIRSAGCARSPLPTLTIASIRR